MQKIIIATKNKGKLAELEAPLKELGYSPITLPDDYEDIVEDGLTFEENALIKARHVCKEYTIPAIADDSGLSVDHLGGAPGIYSARYGDDIPSLENETKDEKNLRKVLEKMENVPEELRACAFHCAMALVFPNGKEIVVHEKWQGRLLTHSQGLNGFGYDPIFFDEELNMSSAEMEKTIKMTRSHRAKALNSLFEELKKI